MRKAQRLLMLQPEVYDGESVVLPDEDGIDVRYNEVRQKASITHTSGMKA
jgi:hypothetical protein